MFAHDHVAYFYIGNLDIENKNEQEKKLLMTNTTEYHLGHQKSGTC